MNKSNIIVKSIGCRLNQYEADMIKSELVKYGFTSDYKAKPDLYILNTCTVTQKADSKSRSEIKKAIKNFPNAYIVVTGCYAQTDPQIFQQIKGVDLVVNNNDKLRIADILKEQGIIKNKKTDKRNIYVTDRTRPYIKIEDGCNLKCSYCKVRIARGKSRSENFDTIIETAQLLADNGYPEIVLTGVNIGDYYWKGKKLSDLLKELTTIENLNRIRLSSIEVTNIDDKLTEVLANKKICGYFHIPLQSGSNKILKLMNRPYNNEQYKSIVSKIKSVRKDTIIGADIIVGFPNESEDDFQETYTLLKELNIFFLHIFRYSKRKGTPAFDMKETVPDIEKKRRATILENYKIESKAEFFKSIIGKKFKAIVEHKIIKEKYLNSVTDNYIPILLPFDTAKKYHKKIVSIEVIKFDGSYLYGKIV